MKTRIYSKSSRKKFTSGKKSFAICDRSGGKYPYSEMIIEPGTGLFVHRSWSDGKWNRVDHPQNFSPDVSETIGLKNPRPPRLDASPVYLRTEDQILILDNNGFPIFVTDY